MHFGGNKELMATTQLCAMAWPIACCDQKKLLKEIFAIYLLKPSGHIYLHFSVSIALLVEPCHLGLLRISKTFRCLKEVAILLCEGSQKKAMYLTRVLGRGVSTGPLAKAFNPFMECITSPPTSETASSCLEWLLASCVPRQPSESAKLCPFPSSLQAAALKVFLL